MKLIQIPKKYKNISDLITSSEFLIFYSKIKKEILLKEIQEVNEIFILGNFDSDVQSSTSHYQSKKVFNQSVNRFCVLHVLIQDFNLN